MTTESQHLIEGNQMLLFLSASNSLFYMKRKTMPLQHQQYKATQKSVHRKAISTSNYDTMHILKQRMAK